MSGEIIVNVEPKEGVIQDREAVLSDEELEHVQRSLEKYKEEISSLIEYLVSSEISFEEFRSREREICNDMYGDTFHRTEKDKARENECAHRARKFLYQNLPKKEWKEKYLLDWWSLTHAEFGTAGLELEDSEDPHHLRKIFDVESGFVDTFPSRETSLEKAKRTIEKYDDFSFESYK